VTSFARRRTSSIVVVLLVGGAIVAANYLYEISFRDPSFVFGWILAGVMVFLGLYNARKKLPFLPLLSNSIWLQAHIYFGWLGVLLFFLHTGFRWPTGPFETVLWSVSVLLLASGIVGLLLSRAIPRRWRRHQERVIFERIPAFRAQLAREVKELAMQSVSDIRSPAISDYYDSRLEPFLRGPRHVLTHLLELNWPLQRLQAEVRHLERYLDSNGRQIVEEIRTRLVAIYNLDHQYAMQLMLKAWLFVHVPLTYSLLPLVAVHVVLVYAFSAGGP